MDSDINYDDLNPGIRETVRKLRSWGFDTCDSGDGDTHQYACDLGYAYVAAEVEPRNMAAMADLLRAKLEEAGVSVGVQCDEALIDVTKPHDAQGVFIEASYSPIDGRAILFLGGLSDKDWP